MTKAIATKENVEAAAEKLLQDGIHIGKINAEQIKTLIEGGSYSTITPLLYDWKNERLDLHVVETPMPLDIAKIMEVAQIKSWYAAIKMSRAYFSTQLEDREQLEEENKYLIGENQEMEAEIESMQKKLDQNNKRFVTVIEACKEGFFTQAGILRTAIESNNPDAVTSYFEEFYQSQKNLLAGALDDQHKIINDHINNLQTSAATEGSLTNTQSTETDLETAAKGAAQILTDIKKI